MQACVALRAIEASELGTNHSDPLSVESQHGHDLYSDRSTRQDGGGDDSSRFTQLELRTARERLLLRGEKCLPAWRAKLLVTMELCKRDAEARRLLSINLRHSQRLSHHAGEDEGVGVSRLSRLSSRPSFDGLSLRNSLGGLRSGWARAKMVTKVSTLLTQRRQAQAQMDSPSLGGDAFTSLPHRLEEGSQEGDDDSTHGDPAHAAPPMPAAKSAGAHLTAVGNAPIGAGDGRPNRTGSQRPRPAVPLLPRASNFQQTCCAIC